MTMPRTLFACAGGSIVAPDPALVLVDRMDGGHLIVNPPRPVWERSELSPHELTRWSCLVAAAGYAMLAVLPQLAGGCINYWEAGNWALHDDADPRGPKTAGEFRQVHLHLLGRSRSAGNADFRWGEAPRFPDYAARLEWARSHRGLDKDECTAIAAVAAARLRDYYGMIDA